MKSGIYKITNNENNMVYVGQTKNLNTRYASHIRKMKKNKHHNEYLQRAFIKYGEDNFEFEILEGDFIQEFSLIETSIKKLSELGIKFSIDDFGTGYSSLAYLEKLPVQRVKIDKTFILNLFNSSGNEKITISAIEIAKNFSLETIAEGVESEATLLRLKELDCDMIQGYFLTKPLPIDNFIDWFDKNSKSFDY